MNNCLRGTINRLQQELNKEIEKQLSDKKGLSSQSIIQISQTLDLLIVQELREQNAVQKKKSNKKKCIPGIRY